MGLGLGEEVPIMNHPINTNINTCTGGGGSSEINNNCNNNNDGVNDGVINNGVVLKKGPWTAAEDAVLMDYVRKHGEGNWNAVQKNSGLSRCGKSCRLRWTNHLRPNLKKGSFSPEEERLIHELHAKLGNKWSRMAAQLPGRTDNEIKNFWNTRMKKRLRAGLLPYPQDSQKQTVLRHFRQNYLSQTLSQTSQVPQPSTQFPLIHHIHQPNYGSLYKFDQINTTHTTPLGSHPQFQRNGVGLSIPFSSSSSLVSPLFNDNFRTQFPLGSTSQCGFNSYDLNPSSILHTPFEPDGIVPRSSTLPMKMELPSSQLSQPAANAPALDTFFDYNFKFPFSQNSSGLLDDLLEEANVISGKKPSTVEEKGNLDGLVSNNPPSGCVFNERDISQPPEAKIHMVDFNLTNGCTDVKMKKEPDSHEFDCADDLSDLLSIIPPAKSNPEMGYSNSGEMSNGHASSVTDDDISLEMQQLVSSLLPMGSAADHDWAFGTWNNMPGIC